ncbi:MAG: Hsp20/alpha crystallin family protein [Verrucomicrobiales bacterium]|nr:Hsp20/alpha crystallin family protein [Verrucomicrobiales bacterium]
MPRKIKLSRAIGKTGDVASQLGTLHFNDFHSSDGWRPNINAYRYDNRFEIWVDLAGIEKSEISVDVLPNRVRISGERKPPIPTKDASSQCRQVLSMEIESGRFAREIELPGEVDREEVTAKQENGLLWIVLPLVATK